VKFSRTGNDAESFARIRIGCAPAATGNSSLFRVAQGIMKPAQHHGWSISRVAMPAFSRLGTRRDKLQPECTETIWMPA